MNGRRWSIIGGVLLALGASGVIAYWLSGPKVFRMGAGLQPKDTEFFAGNCTVPTTGPNAPAFASGVRTAAWNDGVLHIRYGLETNCAAPFNYGGYRRSGDKLTLEYSIRWETIERPDGTKAQMRTACNCGYVLNYRIAGLEKKEYSIDIVSVEKQ